MSARKLNAPVVGLEKADVPADLAPFVQAFVERRDSGRLGGAIELPDPSPLLQFVIGADYEMRRHTGDDAFAPVPAVALWGPTAAVWEARVAGSVHVYCVVLTHLGAAMLARSPIGELVDQRVGVQDLNLEDADIVARLRQAADFAQRTALIVRWLRVAFAARRVLDEQDLALADALAQGRVVGSVETIARDVGISARGLHKKLTLISGWSPKQLLRIARLQTALRQLHPKPWDDLAQHDVMLDFHDQAHFAKDFKDLTGLTPTRYRAAKQALGDSLINTLYLA
jgi:AraC-like DNA-binding protein